MLRVGQVAQKFKLPPSSAARIRIEIEAQMVKRVQLRVSVDLQVIPSSSRDINIHT
jgi:hypothetical protein